MQPKCCLSMAIIFPENIVSVAVQTADKREGEYISRGHVKVWCPDLFIFNNYIIFSFTL